MAAAGSLVPRDPTNVNDTSASLSSAASGLYNTGPSLVNQGSSALGPLFAQLSKLTSGNPEAVSEATRPEATSILRQYDTARSTAARTAQRGGGQASANEASYLSEGSDLANLKSTAVMNARSQLGQLASQVLGIGTQAQSAGAQGFADLLHSALQGKQISAQEWGSVGQGIGQIASIALMAAMFL